MNPQSNIIIVFFTFFTCFCQIAEFSEIRGKLISPYQIHMDSESESKISEPTDDHLSSYSELLNTTIRVKFEENANETEILNLSQESHDENVQEISTSTITSDLDYYDTNDTTEFEEIDYYGEQSYSILGVSEREEEFIVFDGQILQNTTKIHLKNIEIDAQLFTQVLKGLDRLHTLELENIKFTNLSQITRVVLPKLKVFQLHHVYDGQLWEMINFSDKLKSFLFFDKSAEQGWDSTGDLWSLGVDISVKFDVLKILEINHKKSELISALKYSNDILKSIKSAQVNLQKLSLRGVPIDSENLPLNLTYLNLHYVTIPLTKLGEVLGQSEYLKELHLTVDKSLRTPIDITALPQSLQALSLINFLRIEMNSEPQFNLTTLTTNECNFPKDYNYNYYQLKGLSNVAILGPCFEYTQELLGSITDSGAKRIYLNDFHSKENSALEKFLRARGIGSNVHNFVLKKVQGTWLAKEVFPEQNHQEKRSLTGLSQFFNSRHVLQSVPKIDPYFVQDMELKGQKVLQFNGSLFDLDQLSQMSNEEKNLVGTIHLTGVEIGAEFLPKMLGSFVNLRHLFMNNVLVYGSFNDSMELPLLETFVYNEYYPMYRETVLKNRELPREKLESILFFAPDGLNSLRNFSIDISVSVGGIKYLQLNHAKNEIFSRLSYSSVVYDGNDQVKNIILHDTQVKISDLPKGLNSLSLYATEVDEDFSGFLAKNGDQLTQLYFYPKSLSKLDITAIPRGVKNLVLRNCDLVITTSSRRLERKIELDTLALYDCSFPSDFESEIHRYFEISEGFGIFNTFYLKPQSRPNHNMLFSLMKTEAKWMYIFSFDWSIFDEADDEQFSNVINSRIEIASEVEAIVKNAGISKGSNNFLLKKQNSENDGKWVGKIIDMNERSSLSEWLGEEIL